MTKNGFENSLLSQAFEQFLRLTETYRQFAVLATELTEQFTTGADGEADAAHQHSSFTIERMSAKLAEIARRVTDADIAYVRRVEDPSYYKLVDGTISARDKHYSGDIATFKWRDDCDFDDQTVQGGDRTPEHHEQVMRRNKDGTLAEEGRGDRYTDDQLTHFSSISSEAFVPLYLLDGHDQNGVGKIAKAFIVLGHGDKGHFSDERLDLLKALRGFFDQFYRLADLHQDREHKAVLLRHIVAVLPLIAEASHTGVKRAICTLLTCGPGFGFNRAMLFWMTQDGQLPASCAMAIGGHDSSWRDQQERTKAHFGDSLHGYMRDGISRPIPMQWDSEDPDPLYETLCDQQFSYTDADRHLPGPIGELISNPARFRDRAARLCTESSDDPAFDLWLKKLFDQHPEIERCANDEYFLFPLLPFPTGDEQEPSLVGFVICDMAYRTHAHSPGEGFPDLEIAALVMRLVASLWDFRRKADSAFGILGALPALTHNAPKLAGMFDELIDGLKRRGVNLKSKGHPLNPDFVRLSNSVDELHAAANLIAETGESRRAGVVSNVRAAITEICSTAVSRYDRIARAELVQCDYSDSVRISADWLNEVLDVVLQNANNHAAGSGTESVNVQVRIRKVVVPEGNRQVDRIMIDVEDDGVGVAEDCAPYIMIPRVSTSPEPRHGNGLSLAQALLRSIGGGIVLNQLKDPTRFSVVLDKAGS